MSRDPFEDVCEHCGTRIGYGHPLFHLGNCGEKKCQDKAKLAAPTGPPIKAKLGKAKGLAK